MTTALTSGYDVNSLSNQGFYSVVSPTNGPATGNFVIQVIEAVVGGNSRQIQIAYSEETAATYTRIFTGTTGWTSWALAGKKTPLLDSVSVFATPVAGTTTADAHGTTFESGSNTGRFPAASGGYIQSKLNQYLNATGSSGSPYVREGRPACMRGSAANECGFDWNMLFGYTTDPDEANGFRMFAGLTTEYNTVSNTSEEPSVAAHNAIGVCRDSGDSGLQIIHSNASSATKVDISGTFGDFEEDDLYHLNIVCAPGVNQDLVVTLNRVTPGREASLVTTIDGSDANTPISNDQLYTQLSHSNAGLTSTAHHLAFLGFEYSITL